MSNKPAWRNSLLPLVVLLLFLGSMLNYLDRSVLGVVMPGVRRDLSLSNRDYGLAIHAFLVLYAIFYILGGRIADRLGYRRTFTMAIIFWSLATMAHSLVQGLRSLFICEALSGMGEGSYYPAAMRGAAGLFPPASRAKAVGAPRRHQPGNVGGPSVGGRDNAALRLAGHVPRDRCARLLAGAALALDAWADRASCSNIRRHIDERRFRRHRRAC